MDVASDAVLEDLLQRGYRYAVGLTHERGAEEDLVQDAALALARRGGPWAAPYLFTTIRNRFIDTHRRRNVLDVRVWREDGLVMGLAGGLAGE